MATNTHDSCPRDKFDPARCAPGRCEVNVPYPADATSPIVAERLAYWAWAASQNLQKSGGPNDICPTCKSGDRDFVSGMCRSPGDEDSWHESLSPLDVSDDDSHGER